jgi:hypothetical protein
VLASGEQIRFGRTTIVEALLALPVTSATLDSEGAWSSTIAA